MDQNLTKLVQLRKATVRAVILTSCNQDIFETIHFLHKSRPILGVALDSEELYPALHSSFLKVIFREIYWPSFSLWNCDVYPISIDHQPPPQPLCMSSHSSFILTPMGI